MFGRSVRRLSICTLCVCVLCQISTTALAGPLDEAIAKGDKVIVLLKKPLMDAGTTLVKEVKTDTELIAKDVKDKWVLVTVPGSPPKTGWIERRALRLASVPLVAPHLTDGKLARLQAFDSAFRNFKVAGNMPMPLPGATVRVLNLKSFMVGEPPNIDLKDAPPASKKALETRLKGDLADSGIVKATKNTDWQIVVTSEGVGDSYWEENNQIVFYFEVFVVNAKERSLGIYCPVVVPFKMEEGEMLSDRTIPKVAREIGKALITAAAQRRR